MIKQFLCYTLILLLFNGCDKIGSFFCEKSLNTPKTTESKTLEWQTDEPGKMEWQAAMDYCQILTLNGKTDWRLANIKELISLIDFSKNEPAADTTEFPNIHYTSDSYYWSSTTQADFSEYVSSNRQPDFSEHAWMVGFEYGIFFADKKNIKGYVRCVRAAQ